MFRKSVTPFALAVLVMAGSGCATIVQGSSQEVGVSSSPSGASISVNGMPMGTTPALLDLRRKDRHLLRMELAGYQPYEIALTRSVSGWVWGNLAFGGIPGLAVDAITGGMYKLTPEQVAAEMRVSTASADARSETLYIAVVLTPNPEWEQVGQLAPVP